MAHDLEELIAYHEAGHAVMAVALGGQIVHVSIEPPDDDGPKRYGESLVRWPAASAVAVELAELKVSLAGPIAEMIYTSEFEAIESVAEFAADWKRAIACAMKLKPPSRARHELLVHAQQSVKLFLNRENHWAAVAATADELLAHHTIEHESIAEIVSFWIDDAQI